MENLRIKDKPAFLQDLISRVMNTVSVSEVLRVYSISISSHLESLSDEELISLTFNSNMVDLANTHFSNPEAEAENHVWACWGGKPPFTSILADYATSVSELTVLTDLIKVFLDDERPIPEGWLGYRSLEQSLYDRLDAGLVSHLSLDHDLGTLETGYDLCTWIERRVREDSEFKVPVILVHSANPIGRQRMEQAIQSIYNFVREQRPEIWVSLESLLKQQYS